MRTRTIALTLVIFLLSGLSAFGQTDMTGAGSGFKNPGTARIYSIVIPGGGQFYNGETSKGLLHLGAAVVGYTMFAVFFPYEEFVRDDYYWASYGTWQSRGNATLAYGGLALALGSTVWSIIDAPNGARRFNEQNGLASINFGNHTLALNLCSIAAPQGNATGLKLGLSL
jgi:TM2 domain-containing membrane protein YozV